MQTVKKLKHNLLFNAALQKYQNTFNTIYIKQDAMFQRHLCTDCFRWDESEALHPKLSLKT